MRVRTACLILLALSTGALADPGDDRIGQQISIRPDALAAPMATPSIANPPSVVPFPENGGLTVPSGFKATIFAAGLDHPRNLLVLPNGDVLLAESSAGKITLLRASSGGEADLRMTYLEGLSRPFGMALHENTLFIADTRAVWRGTFRLGETRGPSLSPITHPGQLGAGTGHYTRNLALSADAKSLFVAIGSENNIAEEQNPRATIQRLDLATSTLQPFAAGLRNPVGIAVRPGTDALYAVVNERDGFGDELVPDYFTRVQQNGFYGWPYAYIGPHADPTMKGARPDLVAKALVPDLLFRTHSAPIGLVFYTGKNFPARFRMGAFVALRGSWNAGLSRGYKIVYVPFEGDHPAPYYENFATGFRIGGEQRAIVWGRPAGLAEAKDGSLLIADDTGKKVWRIAYVGE